MRKNRIEYLLLCLVLLGIGIHFEKLIFVWIVISMLVLFAFLRLLLEFEKRSIKLLSLKIDGDNLLIKIESPFRIVASIIDLNSKVFYNAFKIIKNEHHYFSLGKRINEYKIKLRKDYVGGIVFSLNEINISDVLNLFQVSIKQDKQISYFNNPEFTNLEIIRERNELSGMFHEGVAVNSKGNDLSEVFDIRNYVQGDDVRTIHWKLSSKMQNLLVKESGKQTFYNLLLFADAFYDETNIKDVTKLISIIYTSGIKLLNLGVYFEFGYMKNGEFVLSSIDSINKYNQTISSWLSSRIPKKGVFEYNLPFNLDSYPFTRILLFGGGKVDKNNPLITSDLYLSVINVGDAYKFMKIAPTCDVTILNVDDDSANNIFC